jgi:hypothetical protein
MGLLYRYNNLNCNNIQVLAKAVILIGVIGVQKKGEISIFFLRVYIRRE